MKCDFCSASPAVRAYRTPDFNLQELPGVQRVSTEGWAACAECRALIDAGEEEGVINRSVDRLCRVNPRWARLPYADARSLVASQHQRFFRVREAVPEECSEEDL